MDNGEANPGQAHAPRPPRCVAVLAVHGVGDHPPFASARAVGDLLAGVEANGGQPKYSVFRENLLRLKVRATNIVDHTSKLIRGQKLKWGPMHAIGASATRLSGTGAGSVDHLFMETQLSQFQTAKADDTYEFLRLDGEQSGGDGRKVHVYEMYWADLSRLGTGFTSIFSELYQLLFHLTSIGINNISAGAVSLRAGDSPWALRRWTALLWSYIAASAIFAWPIAILNLFLVALVPAIVGISLLRKYVPPAGGLPLVLGLGCAVVGGLAAALLLQFRRRLRFQEFAAAFLIPIAAAGFAWWRLTGRIDQEAIEFALGGLLTLASALPVLAVLQAYDRRRPGSLRAGIVLAVLCAGAAVYWRPRLTFTHAPAFKALLAFMNALEIVFWLLAWAWALFAVFYLLTLLTAALSTFRIPQAKLRRATIWTAWLALVLPSLLFLVFTLAGWTGILKVVTPLLPHGAALACYSVDTPTLADICYEPLFPPAECRAHPERPDCGRAHEALRGWADRKVGEAGVALLPMLFSALLLAMLLAIWSFGPSVVDEVKPDLVFKQKKMTGTLGTWLAWGFRFLYPAGWALVTAMTFCLAAPSNSRVYDWLTAHAPSTKLMGMMGTLVAGAGAGLIGFRGRLSELALGFRPVVRVMLDVDNWLREHPRDSNPTARICARYTSLLRHICNYRDQEGRQHDALVIIAHSQGTVITADLLRFLHTEYGATKPAAGYDPELERLLSRELPVYLFTMGCPLRQLYGLRFPFLYEWARHERDPGADIAEIPAGTKPIPDALGVRWSNAFRSGDYVGRHIWRPDNYPDAASTEESTDCAGVRGETCIGAGAHTHYWDESAPEIGDLLDELVSGA